MLPTPENIKKRTFLVNALKQKLIKNLDLKCEAEDLHEDTPLVGAGLGLDSLDVLEIVLCVEGEFGVKIQETDSKVLRSINTIADFVVQQKGGLENV